jgi:hypothetical protein
VRGSSLHSLVWALLLLRHCLLIVALQKTVDMAEKGSVRIVNVSSEGYARVEAVVTNASDLTTLAISTWALRLSSLR